MKSYIIRIELEEMVYNLLLSNNGEMAREVPEGAKFVDEWGIV